MRRKAESKEEPQKGAAPSSKKPFHLEFKNTSQKIAWMAFEQHDILFLLGPAGTGKALTLDSDVYTPTGAKKMGEIKLGDEVSTPDGSTAKVIGVFPQGTKEIFRINFSDGDYVDCCSEHLWKIDSLQNGWKNKVLSTKELLVTKTESGRRKFSIKTPDRVYFNTQEVSIDPYLLGVLLGDGSFRSSSLRFTSVDEQIIEQVKNCLNPGYFLRNLVKTKYCDYVIKHEKKNNQYIKDLRVMNLWGLSSHEKFIPKNYIYNSLNVRLKIIQGLMDTDGTVDKKNGQAVFNTTSKQLALDVKEIIGSLGGICRISEVSKTFTYKGIKKQGKNCFNCRIAIDDPKILFSLERKKALTKKRTKYFCKKIIDSIESVGQKECQCIMVDHPDHLYLTNNFIVTHNSHLAVAFAISELLNKKKKKIMLTRPIVEAGEKLGYLPGPQPLDAKILTPNGWTTMGELKLGDFVIGRDGKPAMVLRIIPQGKKMVYKISTTENTSTEACEDHIWLTQTFEEKKRKKQGNIRTTKQIMESLTNKNNKINHYLPRNQSVEFSRKNLPIPAYVFGALLGDGCFSDAISLIVTNWDNQILSRANEELSSLGCEIVKMKDQIVYNIKSANLLSKKPAKKVLISNLQNGNKTEYDSLTTACKEVKINKGTLANRCKKNLVIKNFKYEFLPLENRWANPLKNIIDKLGLLGKKAESKFIPELYLYSSTEDRIDLLRGLMDTDGTVKENGEASFSTTSSELAKNVVELVQSLGGRAVLRKRAKRLKIRKIKGRIIVPKHESYEFTISLPETINPFYLDRKAKCFKCNYIHSSGIKSIEPVCEKEVQCIMVDNDEHLYITDQYIVTHNTFEEKINPYLMPVFDVMDRMVGKESAERERVNKALEIAPMAYLRGRTFHSSVCILDEAQNASEDQLKMYLTRLGEDSKIIITGDIEQSDLRGDDRYALARVVDNMKVVPGIGVIEFSDENIVRHPLVAAILKAWPSK